MLRGDGASSATGAQALHMHQQQQHLHLQQHLRGGNGSSSGSISNTHSSGGPLGGMPTGRVITLPGGGVPQTFVVRSGGEGVEGATQTERRAALREAMGLMPSAGGGMSEYD